jgi:HPt (histidine-containing phosphotransfer) domain-containing protein
MTAPPQAPSSESSPGRARAVLDSERLLRRFSGRRDLVVELYAMFLDELPAKLENLAQAAKTADMDELSRLAHHLKGACVTIAADECADLAGRLSSKAQDGDQAGAAQALARLESGMSELRRLLVRQCGETPRPPGPAGA